MRHRAGVVAAALAACAAWAPAVAGAEPVSGPHETVESTYTTKRPAAPTGFHYVGRYHAADDPEGDPPYMRKMTSYGSARFDTAVPERCTASDLELALRGPDACPPGSRVGGGTVDGKFMGSPSHLDADVFNNTDEQIIVVRSPFFASVARGTIHPDGSIEFASPTCYPALNPPGCPTDNALQTGSDIAGESLTRRIDGVRRSYMTTPAVCPSTDHWETPITFWWADGSVDTVVTRQPCR